MTFRLVQVLNNNVGLASKEDNSQVVIMGKGLTFQKKKGDTIKASAVQKVFKLHEENPSDLTSLLSTIPLDFLTVSYSLIDEAQEKYDYSVEPYIYTTLTTYLYESAKRLTNGKLIETYLPDLEKDYPLPYEIAGYVLDGFATRLNINFPKQEQKSVALHFLNARTDIHTQNQVQRKAVNKNKQILAIVENELNNHQIYRNRDNANDYERLLVHLKYFINRINQKPVPKVLSETIIKEIIKDYPQTFAIVQKINEQIKQKMGLEFTNDEQVYLTIHIQRLIREEEKDDKHNEK
ncbi:PRD domain-containing protein [Lactobacillus jensenii]|uniref:PRD domain-containing protein n=1 Tax=Lactobacillus jensenii TaxID=109790 RepID=UPI0022445163|nr:PRD domain-containing protein [Lactobacillus jensenii]MCW8081291.1 PRD domain-containing protein [Lactobacillus jensenii]MDK6204589.1 PRD domain-containing protein [Lactobacillus jensenii]